MSAVLFVILFIISMICGAVFCREREVTGKFGKYYSSLKKICPILGLGAFIAGSTELLIDYGTFNAALLLMGVFCLVESLLFIFKQKKPSKTLSFAMKALFAAVMLELTLFNLPTYKLLLGNYPRRSFAATEGTVDLGNQPDINGDILVNNDKELVLAFHDLDFPIGTVYADLTFLEGAQSSTMIIDTKDETNRGEYRFDIAKGRVVADRWRSHYMPCYLSGNVSDIRVKFVVQDGQAAALSSVTFNKPIPFGISIVRLLGLALGSTFVYAVMFAPSMQRALREARVLCDNALIFITAGACMIAVIAVNSRTGGDMKLGYPGGNQISQELVDAFEAGQLNILSEPTEILMNMDDPYDRQIRETTKGADPIWDHVYFDGKYYSYYGIMPVLVLFLPFHKITGKYFSTPVAVLLFALIGIVGLSFLFRRIMKKFFPDIPAGCYIASLMLIHIISGIWFSLGRPDFYEVAMSAGFAFITWGAYFLFTANIVGAGKLSFSRTAVASFLFGAAVLSRPTLVLYCLCAALFMALAVKKAKGKSEKPFTRNTLSYIICAVSPMAVLGIMQMVYNYKRFGSVFEFGIQYSLTISNFTKAEFHLFLAFIAIYNFLLNPPVFTGEYPYIHSEPQYLGDGGFFYMDQPATGNTSGLFFLALPMFSYLLSGRALRSLPTGKDRAAALVYIGLPCVIVPVMIVGSVWESGYAVRYMADFAWQMVLGALAILFYFYCKTQDVQKKKLIRAFLCFSLMWALVVAGVQAFNQTFRFADFHHDSPQGAYDLEQLLAIWR